MSLVDDLIETVTSSCNRESTAKEDELLAIVQALLEDSSDIVGALITSIDGLPQAQILPPNFDARRFSAMSSALLALSTTMAREAGTGKTRNVLVEGTEGNTYVMQAGPNLVLTVFTSIRPNLGLTLAQARRAADRVVLYASGRADEIGSL